MDHLPELAELANEENGPLSSMTLQSPLQTRSFSTHTDPRLWGLSVCWLPARWQVLGRTVRLESRVLGAERCLS